MKNMINGLTLFVYIILSLAVFFSWLEGVYSALAVGVWLFLTYYLGSRLADKGKQW